MAIYNISYTDRETERLINTELGNPYSLLHKIKLNGIGSRRMIIENFSTNMKHLVLKVSGIQYANIELRPKGIIIHINQGVYTYAWTVPFLDSVFIMEIFLPFTEMEILFNSIKKKVGKKIVLFFRK